VDDVVETSVVAFDQGDPQQLLLLNAAAAAAARLHETSEREVDLLPSPVRDPLAAEPEDRGAGFLPAPGGGLSPRRQPSALADVGEDEGRLRPSRLVDPFAALAVAEPLPHATRERRLERVGSVMGHVKT